MDLDHYLQLLTQGKCLPEKDLLLLTQRVKQILLQESNVEHVSAPVTVCGDIHGQFYDLLQLFRIGGQVENTRYLFLGDYVNRGYHSMETFEYLLCLKLKYPKNITLLRGNHECRSISRDHGFYDECKRKYGNHNPWKLFVNIFQYLPLSAVIDSSFHLILDQIFCVHGGLSPSLPTIKDIRMINRFTEIQIQSQISDLVWSDPEDIQTWTLSGRGAGWLFGEKVVSDFCFSNDLNQIVRAHQLVMNGYQYKFKQKNLLTVWSAPNYVYRCGNLGCVMLVKEKIQRQFRTYKQVEGAQGNGCYRDLLPYFL